MLYFFSISIFFLFFKPRHYCNMILLRLLVSFYRPWFMFIIVGLLFSFSQPQHVLLPSCLLSSAALIFIDLFPSLSLPLNSSRFEFYSSAAETALPVQKRRCYYLALTQTTGANTFRASALQPFTPYSACQPSLTHPSPPVPAVPQECAGEVQAEHTPEQGERQQARSMLHTIISA